MGNETKKLAAERFADLTGMFFRKAAQKSARKGARLETSPDVSCDTCGCPRPGKHYTGSVCHLR